MISVIKKYRAAILFLVLIGLMEFFKKNLGIKALTITGSYLTEMLSIIPPIFVLVGLLDVWVPRKIVENHVGPESGFKGMLISLLAGSAAAGPLYGAFPVGETMLKKGCSVKNLVIFLSSWAAIKIPMIMMETNFLGWKFALVRFALTVPMIFIIGILTEKFINAESIPCLLADKQQ